MCPHATPVRYDRQISPRAIVGCLSCAVASSGPTTGPRLHGASESSFHKRRLCYQHFFSLEFWLLYADAEHLSRFTYSVEHYTCVEAFWEISISDTGAMYSRMANRNARKKVLKKYPSDSSSDTGSWIKRFCLSNDMVITIIVGILALNVAYFGYWRDTLFSVSHFFSPSVDWNQRQESVKDAFVESWEGYFRDAWGVFTSLPCGFNRL